MIEHIKHVFFELSNYCPEARNHPLCPLHEFPPHRVLSTLLIVKTLELLGQHEYQGWICFSRYNEPMADPRLCYLLEKAARLVPNARTRFVTNGKFLDNEFLYFLGALHTAQIFISNYGTKEERAEQYRKCLGWQHVFSGKIEILLSPPEAQPHDPTLLLQYGVAPAIIDRPCGAPLHEINIDCQGNVVLCCRDWRSLHTFGNLHDMGLLDIIHSTPFVRTWKQLMAGQRVLPLCQRCSTVRGFQD